MYYISLSYATFGIETKDNIITEAAPIAKWMIGKHIHEIEKWVLSKKGTILKI